MLEPRFELSSWVGREAELDKLEALLESVSVLTLTGPPGVGKSRLAVCLAARHSAAMRTRVVRLDLADAATRAHLANPAAYCDTRSLIVLDNCDHALAACLEFVTCVVGKYPHVKVVATSRERIGATFEFVWQVPPLGVPAPDADHAAIAAAASVRLFVSCAQAIRPSFSLTDANLADVATICRAVDGLPLAIELAATRTSVLPLRTLAERVDGAIRLHPADHAPDATVAGFGTCIEWSLSRLSADEQDVLWDMSVLSGSWTIGSAGAVCGERAVSRDTLSILTRLVSCSLVRKVEDQPGSDVRYALLGVVRRYAQRRLEASGRAPVVRRRHAEWCRCMMQAVPYGTGELGALERLRLEEPNFLAGLAWAVETADTDLALGLVNVLHGLWYIRGHFSESRAWFEKVLALPGGAPMPRALVMNWASNHALGQGDCAAAIAWSEQVRAAAVELSDPMLGAIGLDGLVSILLEQGDLRRAQQVLVDELELCTNLELIWLQCCAMFRMARIQVELGKLDYAQELAEQALVWLTDSPNVWTQVRLLHILGCIALERGDAEAASEHLSSALATARSLEDARGTIEVLLDIARLELRRGNARLARRLVSDAFDRGERCDEALAFLRVLDTIIALRALARPEAVLHLAGAVTALRERQQTARFPLEQARYDTAVATALSQVRHTAGELALAAGRSLDREAAARVARELLDTSETGYPRETPATTTLLTPREAQIARLMARGLTNRAIGAELFISEGTVRAHVEHILSKLGLKSRVEVAATLTHAPTPAQSLTASNAT